MGLLSALLRAFQSDDGQTLVEYSLIIALVAVMLVSALVAFRVGLGDAYADIVAAIP